MVLLLPALGWVSDAARAADPVPYTVRFVPTGEADLDAAVHDSSQLLSLRESAPVGPFALVARSRADADRFTAALGSFGYYAGRVSIRVAGHPLDNPDLLRLLE